MPKKVTKPNQKITDFYKSKKNVDIPDEEVQSKPTTSTSDQFYGACLSQQLQCNKVTCVNVKSTLQNQIREVEKKIEERKDNIDMCKIIIAEKQSEIEDLKKRIETKVVPLSSSEKPLLFSEFNEDFTEQQLSRLRSIGTSKREDSTFVALSMRSMYEGRLETLQTKTLTGRGLHGNKKEKLTPEKVSKIKNMFEQRIDESVEVAEQRVARKKLFNKYIRNAQRNITIALKSETEAEQVTTNLKI